MAAEERDAFQLDPFAFPSETKGRFVMLIVAALAFGVNLGNIVQAAVIGNAEFRVLGARYLTFIRRWWGINSLTLGPEELAAFARQEAAVVIDSLGLLLRLAVPSFLTLLLLVLAAAIFYRGHAVRLRRHYQTRPLTSAEAPRVVADLERCANRLGLALPRLEYSPSGLAQGHAFGAGGGEVLLLQGTPALLESSWGEDSRAIALHELAHLANGDSREREKAKAVWTVFLIALFLSQILMLGLSGRRFSGVVILQALAMIGFVRAIWAGLIRVREFYADWRAASQGAKPALERILRLPEGEVGKWEHWEWYWRAWDRWEDRGWWRAGTAAWDGCWRHARRIVKLHPSFAARRKVLADPDLLFRISPDLPFLTGVLLTLVLIGSLFFFIKISVVFLGGLALVDSVVWRGLAALPRGVPRDLLLVGSRVVIVGVHVLAVTGALFGLSYLVAGAIGVQVQRQAFYGLARRTAKGWGYLRLMPSALLFAAGMEVGFFIAPFNPLQPAGPENWKAILIWLASFTVLTWLWLAYVHGLSRMLLGSYAGKTNPRLRRAVVTWSSVGLLTVLYWPAAFARITLQMAYLMHSKVSLPLPLPSGAEPRRVFIYGFFITLIVMLVFAVAVYTFWAVVTLAGVRIGPLRWKKRCSICKEATTFRLSLGQRCTSCGSPLALWIFARTETTPLNAGALK
jgi:Zn-dependent protease with chaperone function